MPRYLIIGSYTAQGEEGLLAKGGTARRASVTEMVEKLGGRIGDYRIGFWPPLPTERSTY